MIDDTTSVRVLDDTDLIAIIALEGGLNVLKDSTSNNVIAVKAVDKKRIQKLGGPLPRPRNPNITFLKFAGTKVE